MTNSEFKAWFDGFSEGIYGQPTAKQWDRIKKRVKEIDDTHISPQIVREYYRDWWPTHYPVWLDTPQRGPLWDVWCGGDSITSCVLMGQTEANEMTQ